MRRLVGRAGCLVQSCVLGLLPLLPAGVQAADIDKLNWLGGCWQADGAKQGSAEHWMPLAGGTLLGVNRMVKGGKTVAYEFMQIRANGNGKLEYVAMPSGQQTTIFTLLRIDESEAVFENPEHDFPQRVIYRLEDKTKLRARIEGMRDEELRVIEFPMTRMNCEQ